FFQILGYEFIPAHKDATHFTTAAKLDLDVAGAHFDGRLAPEIGPFNLNPRAQADADPNGAEESLDLYASRDPGIGIGHKVEGVEIDNRVRAERDAGPGEAKVGTDLHFQPRHQGF